jgi:hypothetical protein
VVELKVSRVPGFDEVPMGSRVQHMGQLYSLSDLESAQAYINPQ